MSKTNFYLLALILSVSIFGGCAVEAAKTGDGEKNAPVKNTELAATKNAPKTTNGATIEIEQNSPADSVRVFYKNLRENRFRDAIFLTNLRPAVEGLTDAELAALKLDLAALSQQIPAEVQINGEIISGNYATVTAKLPDNETDKTELQEIRLRKEGDYWTILTVDEKAEKIVKKQGNQYFFTLRLQTHENETRKMMQRISKAEMVYAVQNGGNYGEMNALIANNLLPEDIRTADSTGYNYKIFVADDKTKYSATAEPAEFGKTGKLSFLLDFDKKQNPLLTEKENDGKTLKK